MQLAYGIWRMWCARSPFMLGALTVAHLAERPAVHGKAAGSSPAGHPIPTFYVLEISVLWQHK